MLSVGDRIPNVTLMRMTGEGPAPVGSGEALGSGTVVLFAVPGAFTPTCSDHHLPGYVRRADELRAKGVDTVACIAVNDAFVLKAWGDSVGAGGEQSPPVPPERRHRRVDPGQLPPADLGQGPPHRRGRRDRADHRGQVPQALEVADGLPTQQLGHG